MDLLYNMLLFIYFIKTLIHNLNYAGNTSSWKDSQTSKTNVITICKKDIKKIMV